MYQIPLSNRLQMVVLGSEDDGTGCRYCLKKKINSLYSLNSFNLYVIVSVKALKYGASFYAEFM